MIEPLCDNHVIGTARSANSKRSLTPSLDLGKEGLGMNPTRALFKGKSAEEKLLLAHTKTPEGCMRWQGMLTPTGYGLVRSDEGRNKPVHRVAYELWVGPIPAGLEIDHLCRVRDCINPEHLEAVTHRENIMRSNNPIAIQAMKTHCVRGHEFTTENTKRRPGGTRVCRACLTRRVECDECGISLVFKNLTRHRRNIHGA